MTQAIPTSTANQAGARTPTSVAVLGSCMSRDVFNSKFNPGYKDFYSCPIHQNQSSIISLMSPEVVADWEPLSPMNDYDRWNVATEFDKSFLAEAVRVQPEVLVLDFFADVHFGALRLPDGRYLTDNRWKLANTDWYRDEMAAGRLTRLWPYADQDAYLEVWTEAFTRFTAWFRASLPETQLVLHRGHNAGKVALDEGGSISLFRHKAIKKLDLDVSNAWWERLDARAVEISGAEVIDITGPEWFSPEDHPWGAWYVHYDAPYYRRFLGELHLLRLGHDLSQADFDRVLDYRRGWEAEAELFAERNRYEVAELRGRVKRLRKRAVEAEERLAASPVRRLARRLRLATQR